MRKNTIKVMSVVMILVMLLASSAYAMNMPQDEQRFITPKPTMRVVGNTATCKVRLSAPGRVIDATLTLSQGSTVIASWSGTSTGVLTLSGTATVISGLTYTLTVSGTIDGIAFTPESITKTP